MNIGIDISQIAYKGTGVARYTDNLVKVILEYDHENDYTFFFSSLRLNLDPDLEQQIKQKHRLVKVKLPPTLLDLLWNRMHIIPIETFIGKQDIFISSDWTQPPSSAKKMTIVHDLVYLRYPETVHKKILAVQRRRLNLVKKEVDLILADSHATKKDLIELLSIPENKIHVLFPAVEIKHPTENDIDRVNTKYKIQNTKYCLSVGKLEPRKNISCLIEAFQLADLKDIQLLIVGPDGWNSGEKLAGLREPANIKFLGYVPDSELYSLYSNAEFFIYPSLYEGFGYPVVEAMALGCPVATSNSSSLAEIGKDSALLFDPKGVEEIKNAIIKLSTDSKLREKLVEKGNEEAKKYSSANFAKSFLSAIALRS